MAAATGVAAASLNPVNSMANGGAAPADAADGVSPFEPSVWGDFFANYTNPISKESQDETRERARHLQGEVRRMFAAAINKQSAADDLATLVDTVEHLGIDHSFRDEIAAAMRLIRSDDLSRSTNADDLHAVALRFRLLRQHGVWVPADVFDRFRDQQDGSFSTGSKTDPIRGLLSLYDAAHMAVPGETALDDAVAFARRQLEAAVKGGLVKAPLAEQVARALDIPRPRISRRVETMHYVAEYQSEEGRDDALLELARLEFELVRCQHLEELREFSSWWKELYNDVKLPYARDRSVEIFFWTCGVIPEAEHARARMMFAKTFAFSSLIDDTHDVHAALEESRRFNQAMQRWDESAVSEVPEYLRRLFLRTMRGFQEFEDMLEPDEKYRMPYVIKAYKLLNDHYYQEAVWANAKHLPSFAEQVRVTTISSGLPMLVPVHLLGLPSGCEPSVTRKAFEWAADASDALVLASGQVGRFLNDMAAYTLGKNRNDVASVHECYVKEFGVSRAEAFAAIAGMLEDAWRTINRGCMADVDADVLPAVKMGVVDLSRSMEIIYLGGRRDAYTFASNIKDLVTAFFLKPVVVSA